jgi:hypothetical protein
MQACPRLALLDVSFIQAFDAGVVEQWRQAYPMVAFKKSFS